MDAEIVAGGLAAAGHEITIWSMFWQAAFVVKLVMVGLLAASVWCWGIIIDKSILYSKTQAAMDRFEDVFWSGQSLDELYDALENRPTSAMGAVFVAAMREWKRSIEGQARSFVNLSQRIDKVLDVTIQREVERALGLGEPSGRLPIALTLEGRAGEPLRASARFIRSSR